MSDVLTIEFEGRRVYLDEVCPVPGPWVNLNQAIDANRSIGHHWFTAGAMEFFATKVESILIMGRFFVTSESPDKDAPRRYTLRAITDRGQVVTIGPFYELQTYPQTQELLDKLLERMEEEGAL